ncbi:TlpA family protein disulfide reductase [Patescibacteria group bacterium]
MIKKSILFITVIALFAFIIISPSSAQQVNEVNIYFFWGEGCPHCAEEELFLEKITDKYPEVNIIDFEIWNNRDNVKLLQKISQGLDLDIRGVPFTIIGSNAISGYLNSKTTGKQIQSYVEECINSDCPDIVAPIIAQAQPDERPDPLPDSKDNNKITLPILGEIDPTQYSLPVLTIVIAALDGFNPCAMWVLLFLISLLLGMENKKRMWTLGITFIVVSGLIYFLFLSAWLNLFLFIGFIFWVRILIGIVAMSSGGFHLWEFYKNRPGCKVIKGERRDKIFTNLKFITKIDKFWLALIGIVIIAFAVNLIELVCSAGLPAIYTNVLSLSDLSTWQYYSLLILYIIIFMLDDMLVFVIAMVTLQATGLGAKYTRYANLIGGIIILILGILLILRPHWLMFS